MLSIHLYNLTNQTRQAILFNAAGIVVERGINGTDSISFSLPQDDSQIDLIVFGSIVRVYDTDSASDLGAGVIAGTRNVSELAVVRFNALGMLARLGNVMFPIGYILSGLLSANKTRFVSSFDVRRVSTATSAAVGALGSEVCTWDGSGVSNNSASKANVVTKNYLIATDEDDASGRLLLKGKNQDLDGAFVVRPYNSPGTYESPFLDFLTAPTEFDRLKYGGDWVDAGNEVQYRIASFDLLTDGRVFTGSSTTVTDPEGLGQDISAVTARRFVAVEFLLTSISQVVETVDGVQYRSGTPILDWFEVIARRDIAGITAGSFPAIELEGNLNVGGESVLRVLDQIAGQFDCEYRMTSDGILQVQVRPLAGLVGAIWGQDRRAQYLLSEGLHCNILRYDFDDDALWNQVTAVGTGAGGNATTTTVRDEPSITAYGLRETTFETNRKTLVDLLTDARAYLDEHREPRTTLRIEVFDTPDGTFEFEPGDLIRVVSEYSRSHEPDPAGSFAALEGYRFSELELRTFDQIMVLGGTTSEALRIITERREQTDTGVVVTLDIENRRMQYTDEVVQDIAELSGNVRSTLKSYATGVFYTASLSGAGITEYTIGIDFVPSDAFARVVEVESPAGGGVFYTPHGSVSQVEVVYRKLGTRRVSFAVKQVSGSGSYVAQVEWRAWGTEWSSESLTP